MEDKDSQPPRLFPVLGPGMRVWLLIALYFACLGLFSLLSRVDSLAWLNSGSEGGYHVNYARFANAIYILVALGLPAILYANVFPAERFNWFKVHVRVRPQALLFGAIALVAIIPVLDSLYAFFISKISDPELIKYEQLVDKESAWRQGMPVIGDLFLLIFTSALIPAICEELFFRGTLQQLIGEWFPNSRHIGVPVTALIFAFLHFDVAGFPIIFIAGLLLGYAFYWTGSLRTSMVMHFLFNAASLVLSYAAQHNKSVASWEPSALVICGCTVVGFVSFGLLNRFSVRKQETL